MRNLSVATAALSLVLLSFVPACAQTTPRMHAYEKFDPINGWRVYQTFDDGRGIQIPPGSVYLGPVKNPPGSVLVPPRGPLYQRDWYIEDHSGEEFVEDVPPPAIVVVPGYHHYHEDPYAGLRGIGSVINGMANLARAAAEAQARQQNQPPAK